MEGLEPSASRSQNGHDTNFVTSRRVYKDSNPESLVYKTNALPIKLYTLNIYFIFRTNKKKNRPGLESNQ